MAKKKRNWFSTRRNELNLSQDDIAAGLQKEGFTFTRSTVSGWDSGNHHPPLFNREFCEALAKILQMSRRELIELAFDLPKMEVMQIDESGRAWLRGKVGLGKTRSFLAILSLYDEDMKSLGHPPIIFKIYNQDDEEKNNNES